MRKALVLSLLSQCDDPSFCFLTGDLGFMALEPLQTKLGKRFINMGIAEQNMISVAAGIAKTGMRPWLYSIAPFCYARPFEQIRNDICLHDLPVRIIGNGAGYGYGVQGPSHHGLEDCAVMGSLQNMYVYAPAFSADLAPLVELLSKDPHPGYLRLGKDEGPAEVQPPPFAPFRKLCDGSVGLILALGSLAGAIWKEILEWPKEDRPTVWCCSQIPRESEEFPMELFHLAAELPWTIVIEEHVATGGLASCFACSALKAGIYPKRFIHKCALGYPGKLYGSQEYHRKESGLCTTSLCQCIASI